jgi:hypothetical protein
MRAKVKLRLEASSCAYDASGHTHVSVTAEANLQHSTIAENELLGNTMLERGIHVFITSWNLKMQNSAIVYMSFLMMILKHRSQNGYPSRSKKDGSSNGLLQPCKILY